MGNLLTFKYWFNLYPASMHGLTLTTYLVFTGMLLLGAIYFGIFKQKKGALYYKSFKKVFHFSLTNLIIALLYLFFIMQTIPVLSSRFWFILWFCVSATWLYFIIKNFKQIPKIKKEREKLQEYQKYIP